MPKIAKSVAQKQAEIITNNIYSRAAMLGYRTDKAIAKILCVCPSTMGIRRKCPETWQLAELIRATVALKCSLEWLIKDHSGEAA